MTNYTGIHSSSANIETLFRTFHRHNELSFLTQWPFPENLFPETSAILPQWFLTLFFIDPP